MSINTRNRGRDRGFTLIELMVSLVLGLIVVGGVMAVFISTYQSNAQNIKAVRLNEEMRAVMSLITRDIRRAGVRSFSWNATTPNWFVTNNFAASGANWVVTRYDTTVPPKSCALFAYDTNGNNTLDNVDRMGYRLNPNGAIEAYNHTAGGWSCNGASWQPVTDERIAWVQSLVFTATTESALASVGVNVRTVIVTLRAGTNTRSGAPATVTAADCSKIDVACRTLIEKIRLRNDALL
ncbi:MAG: PilW family protein [Immundisolibacter sp.]|uniref:PilW family protein n=1 Tax=Immundisolibacter sp. TaxID=1934948 RepID=UPI003EDF65C0